MNNTQLPKANQSFTEKLNNLVGEIINRFCNVISGCEIMTPSYMYNYIQVKCLFTCKLQVNKHLTCI